MTTVITEPLNFTLLLNCSGLDANATNCTADMSHQGSGGYGMAALSGILTTLYGVLCVFGLIGNGLVIYVVLQYTKMKTVTNMYILNLAVSDLCFLVGLPFLITTLIVRYWVFGFVMCKIFMILTSINWFTSVFTLTVMSADRYLAVCHAVKSMVYRTPVVSAIVCVCVWTVSFLVMLPIILYSTTVVTSPRFPERESCTILWPEGQPITSKKAFIWYTFLLGFGIPVPLIVVFYALVLLRLKNVGPKTKSKEKKKSHRKVTKMVLTVITVYIICWLPYWVFQLVLANYSDMDMAPWKVYLFQIITSMSYANSTLNPVIYAFLSENFRKAFIKAFKCAKPSEVNGALQMEHSVCPTGRRHAGKNEKSTRDSETDLASANTTLTTKTEAGDSSASQLIVAKDVPEEDLKHSEPVSL